MIARRPHSLGFVARNFHVFLFRPSQPHGNYSGHGFHLRVRRAGVWHHLLVRLGYRVKHEDPDYPNRLRSYEACFWKSRDAVNRSKRTDNRIGFKRYVRVKICPGGPRPEERE